MTSRTRARGATMALALALVTAATAGVAAAGVDAFRPPHAQADVDAAMKERGFTFCSDPRRPLSSPARALCAHASTLPDCAGFAAACASDAADEESPWLRRLARWLSGLVPDFVKNLFRYLAHLPAVVFLVLVGAVLVAGILAVARSMRTLQRAAALREHAERRPAKPEDALAELVETSEAEALLALADGHARGGRNDVALQLYLAASLRALDHRGAVRWARDRTNGEYARSCTEEPSRAPLREIAREADRVQFGRTPATSGVVSRAAQLAAGIVRWLPIVVAALAFPTITGCGALKGPRVGDDPAGDELFHELLKRQGAVVDPLDGPLASLAPPREHGPAVIVDAEATPLDDETRAHLVDWVHAGGVLVLVGAPEAWPSAFGAKTKETCAHALSAWTRSEGKPSAVSQRGTVVAPAAFAAAVHANDADTEDELDWNSDDERPEDLEPVASLDDGATYAAAWPFGRGLVLGMASRELLTNAALARPGNAGALLAILSHTDRRGFSLAEAEDGAAGASSPVDALRRSGLGLALVQSLVAGLVLFLAMGVRLARPKPASPPLRRAFVEHVEAVGALYARTNAARHALTSYGRFVEQRLRARMPRGTVDVAAFLASRAQLPREVCERLLSRASATGSANTAPATENRPATDDLMVLKELSAAYASATAHDD